MRALKFAVAAVCAIALTPALPAQALTSRSITLSMSTSLVVSTNFAFSGKVTKTAKGSTVVLQRKSGSKWVEVKKVKTLDSSGKFSSSTKASSTAGSYSYRAYVAKTSKLAAATSKTVTVRVRKKVSVLNFAADVLSPASGVPVTFSGTIKPWVAGTRVRLDSRPTSSSTFTTVVGDIIPNSAGAFSKSDASTEGVNTVYRVVVSQTANYASAVSSPVTITRTNPEIATSFLPDGTQNVAYSAPLATKDGRPGGWSQTTGSLPNGVTLTSSSPTGVLSGTPSGTGPSTFKIKFTDTGNRSVEVEYNIRIDSGTPLPTPTHTTVSAGGSDTCRVIADATLSCWGRGLHGELGVGLNTQPVKQPTDVNPKSNWASVDSGTFDHTCGIKRDRSLWCWGAGDSGKLGLGEALPVNHSWPAEAGHATAAGMHFKQAAAGYLHTCGIRTDDTLWCWGQDNGGTAITQVDPGTTWKQVDAGQFLTCAIDLSSKLWCWGNNASGSVGDGTSTPRPSPVQIGNDTWSQVVTGAGHACGIKTDGTLWCWGPNSKGELGDGTTTQRSAPVREATNSTWTSVSVAGSNGFNHTCAIKSDGSLYCWGSNVFAELGVGESANTNAHPTPLRVEGANPPPAVYHTDWESVSAGGAHTCGVRSVGGGQVRCWGSNSFGQIGVSDPNNFHGGFFTEGDPKDDPATIFRDETTENVVGPSVGPF